MYIAMDATRSTNPLMMNVKEQNNKYLQQDKELGYFRL